jgi:hypothetical protein
MKCPKCGSEIELLNEEVVKLQKQMENEKQKAIEETRKLLEAQKNAEIENAKLQVKAEQGDLIAKLQNETSNLQKQIDEKAKIVEAQKNAEIAQLKGEIKNTELKIKEEEREKFDRELKEKENKIITLEALKKSTEDALKAETERKQKRNIKIIGEELEQFCFNEFNKIRQYFGSTSKNIYFDKDNQSIKEDDDVKGTKGDFIYKEVDDNKNEVLTIMFEMKSEAADSVNKKKNADHFKKLDNDRRKKGLEYAVLVSELEIENEYYDAIVPIYEYEKMYVVRPANFTAIINLLRDKAVSLMSERYAVIEAKNKNLDLSKLEDGINDWQKYIFDNVKKAVVKNNDAFNFFDKTIEDMKKAVTDLEKARDALKKSNEFLEKADDKAQEDIIKKLSRGNGTVKEYLENKPKDKNAV